MLTVLSICSMIRWWSKFRHGYDISGYVSKYGSFVTDLEKDGVLDFIVQGPTGVVILDENGGDNVKVNRWKVQLNKTGGIH